jgi:hypothetical protein
MESLVALLKDVLNLTKVANVTLPGMIVAAALAIFLWPPHPLNVVPTVVVPVVAPPNFPNPPRRDTTSPDPFSGGVIEEPEFSNLLNIQPACSVNLFRFADSDSDRLRDDLSQVQQFVLEREKANLEACLEEESRLLEKEKMLNEQILKDVELLETDRSSVLETVVLYQKTNSPLLDAAKSRMHDIALKIEDSRMMVRSNAQKTQDRLFEIARLKRFRSLVEERLADPRRLRPERGFDDYLKGLSNHVIAFIVLSLAVGIILKSLNATGANVLYRMLFR